MKNSANLMTNDENERIRRKLIQGLQEILTQECINDVIDEILKVGNYCGVDEQTLYLIAKLGVSHQGLFRDGAKLTIQKVKNWEELTDKRLGEMASLWHDSVLEETERTMPAGETTHSPPSDEHIYQQIVERLQNEDLSLSEEQVKLISQLGSSVNLNKGYEHFQKAWRSIEEGIRHAFLVTFGPALENQSKLMSHSTSREIAYWMNKAMRENKAAILLEGKAYRFCNKTADKIGLEEQGTNAGPAIQTTANLTDHFPLHISEAPKKKARGWTAKLSRVESESEKEKKR